MSSFSQIARSETVGAWKRGSTSSSRRVRKTEERAKAKTLPMHLIMGAKSKKVDPFTGRYLDLILKRRYSQKILFVWLSIPTLVTLTSITNSAASQRSAVSRAFLQTLCWGPYRHNTSDENITFLEDLLFR